MINIFKRKPKMTIRVYYKEFHRGKTTTKEISVDELTSKRHVYRLILPSNNEIKVVVDTP